MIPHDELKQYLSYDPETGVFCRLKFSSARWKPGKITGTNSGHGYIKIGLNHKQLYAHRLAWFYVYGEWPEEIDHINGDRADNRLVNLRSVTKPQNNQNMAIQKSNTSGYKGVSWCSEKKRWKAQISIENKNKFIGRFDTKEQAYAAYLMEKLKHHKFANMERI